VSFQLVTKRSFDKEFAGLPKDIQRRVTDAFLALGENPFPPDCVKLKRHSQLPHSRR
jgi:mRNA-degrading endonuclease RelE of RelBE toxin-antitoxin system